VLTGMLKSLLSPFVPMVIAGVRIAGLDILVRVTPVHIAALILVTLCVSLNAGETTGPETVVVGDRYTSNWRSDDFMGSATRTWNASGDSFGFAWRTQKGDQIGRIGRSRQVSNPGLGVRVDDIRDGCIMSVTASMTNLVSSVYQWHMWTIYGWTHEANVPWPKDDGWNNEFYVVFHTTCTQPQAGDGGHRSIGSVTINGAVFDCYTNSMAWGTTNQTQWMAIARNPSWTASVDLKKVFAYWRSKGLPNDYVVDLTWAIEAWEGSSGNLSLSNVNIPRLAPSNAPPPTVRQAGDQQGGGYSQAEGRPVPNGAKLSDSFDHNPNRNRNRNPFYTSRLRLRLGLGLRLRWQ
jgi:hypothetical protein